MRRAALICAALGCLLVCGCQREGAPTAPRTVQMKIGQGQFTLEVADTDFLRQQGLSYRQSMPADHGMIFVFGGQSRRSFWMKGTLIPLDIIFLDTAGKVVSIHQMKPMDLSPTFSGGPAKYAIELNQGAAEQARVRVGDHLEIPPEAREPRQ